MPNFRAAGPGRRAIKASAPSKPPQSPVAWSNFVTGMNPGGHGIFDFLHRDPATYAPVSSATRAPETEASALHLFGYVLPLSGGDSENNRAGTPWWDALVESGVDVEVYRIPGNFPTPESKAKVLDGMGTTDLRGGFGTYTLYTDVAVEKDDPKGDVQFVTVHDLDLDGTSDTVTSILRGPPDLFHLEPGQIPREGDYLTTGVTVHVDPTDDAAVVEIAGKRVLIRQGEWSDWVEVSFDLLPLGMMPVSGTVRFYAKQLRPQFQLYVSPVNISAANPHAPVTSPDDFVEELFGEVGFFYTQGMPEEQEALKDGVFDDDEYLKQVALVQEDTRRLLDLALSRFEAGDATFAYFSDIDLQSHMLWRHGDPKYPERSEASGLMTPRFLAGHIRDIENFYRDVDSALGEVRKRLPREHAADRDERSRIPAVFTRDVHLNAWLRENGYLVMKPGKTTGYTLGDDVDWSKTRAYGIGFNGLYLNLARAERRTGIVEVQATPTP